MIGRTLEGYRLIERVGQGGMGTVYKARDLALDKLVALKVIAPHLAGEEAFLHRFRTEAQALARLDAPGIVRVHALRETPEATFIVLELVEGETLADRLHHEGPMPWPEAVALARQVAQALAHAHDAGVLHRDLTPGNILLDPDGRAKVTDFGLARITHADDGLTTPHDVAGSTCYMAPEQIRGLRHVDERGDLFALGMILFEMLTGRLPIERRATPFAVQQQILDADFPPPERFAPSVPPALSAVVMRLLAKDPAARFPTADALIEALSSVESAPVARRSGRGLGVFATTLLVGLALLVGGFFAFNDGLRLIPDTAAPAAIEPPGEAAPSAEAELPPTPAIESSAPDSSTPELSAPEPSATPPVTDRSETDRVAMEETPSNAQPSRGTATRPLPPATQRTESPRSAPPPRPAPAPQPATLTLRVQPWGTVTVGGTSRGRVEATTLTLSPGSHTVQIDHPELGRWQQQITVDAAEARTLTVDLRAIVDVTVLAETATGAPLPNATIFVDGVEQGFTPQRVPMRVGERTVVVRRTGYEDAVIRRTVAEGVTLTARLEPMR